MFKLRKRVRKIEGLLSIKWESLINDYFTTDYSISSQSVTFKIEQLKKQIKALEEYLGIEYEDKILIKNGYVKKTKESPND